MEHATAYSSHLPLYFHLLLSLQTLLCTANRILGVSFFLTNFGSLSYPLSKTCGLCWPTLTFDFLKPTPHCAASCVHQTIACERVTVLHRIRTGVLHQQGLICCVWHWDWLVKCLYSYRRVCGHGPRLDWESGFGQERTSCRILFLGLTSSLFSWFSA